MRRFCSDNRDQLKNICATWHLTTRDRTLVGIDPSQHIPPGRRNGRARNKRDKEHLMLDFVMLALGLGFFVVAVGYTYACERL
jgi:hypothetical protein